MKLIIEDADVKEAIAEWLAKKGFTEIETLEPVMQTEGQYEDAQTVQTGWQVILK